MKAYVIKNKEGKYCQISFNGWIGFVSELCCAYIYHSKKGAERIIKCHALDDCEVVEITIVEGDLEQQIRADERRKVCEEIRDMFLKSLELPDEKWVWNSGCYAGMSLIKEILDKLEGETK